MGTITHGHITVTIPDELDPPEKAGKMSPDEVSHIARPPRGIGLACDKAGDAMKKAGAKFTAPAGVTPESIVAAGQRAEGIDLVINDLEVVLQTLKQANLLFDADAYEMLRKVNDQVKAQGKHAPELLTIFKDVLEYFARARGPKAAPPAGGGEPKGGNGPTGGAGGG